MQILYKVWWKCDKGHEWFTVIGSRAVGHGCPVCNRGGKKKTSEKGSKLEKKTIENNREK